MELNVNRALLDQDPSAKSLVESLEESDVHLRLTDAVLYFNFPLYRDANDSSSRVHVLLASPHYDLVLFETSAASLDPHSATSRAELLTLADRLEQSASQVFSRLVKSRKLRARGQSLKVQLHQILYLPNAPSLPEPSDIPDYNSLKVCAGFSQVKRYLTRSARPTPLNLDDFLETIALLEGSTGIVTPKERTLDPAAGDTKGKVLREIEVAIANFDRDQKHAAMNILDGPQRIRGLAGSGKTIVLAWKAALIHVQNPTALVLYTYYTKSLYRLIKTLITRFYRHYAERDPDWDMVQILHAWGGRNLPGAYSAICAANGVPPLTLSDARGHAEEPFDYVCKHLLKQPLRQQCDYALIDEGQDFPSSFYKLCHRVTKKGRVIWAYDECQNILNVEIQDPKETFGRDAKGQYLVDLEQAPPGVQNDIVLHRCYRNPRHVLIYAFALGLGLYNDPILQMLENNEHWEDLGFRVLQGRSRTGEDMVVERPLDNSPLVMNRLFGTQETIEIMAAAGPAEEVAYVAQQVIGDLRSELLPEDVLIISLDDRYARRYFSALTARLAQAGVKCFNLLDAPVMNRSFVRQGYVTLSTVYRAKGNEAGVVYVLGVDNVFAQKNSIVARNKLFTAMTRAKGWLTITGSYGPAQEFMNEYSRVKADFPLFRFKMPDRRTLKTFQRDLSAQQVQLQLFEREIEEHARRMGVSREKLLEMVSEAAQLKKNGK